MPPSRFGSAVRLYIDDRTAYTHGPVRISQSGFSDCRYGTVEFHFFSLSTPSFNYRMFKGMDYARVNTLELYKCLIIYCLYINAYSVIIKQELFVDFLSILLIFCQFLKIAIFLRQSIKYYNVI